MNAAHLLHDTWGYILVASPGLWAVWKQWRDSRRAGRKERVDLVKIAQEAAADVIGSLRERVDDLEKELSVLRKEHAETVSAKDAKITLLEGQLRQALATAAAYERLLTEKGIPHEQPVPAFWELASGAVRSIPAGEATSA